MKYLGKIFFFSIGLMILAMYYMYLQNHSIEAKEIWLVISAATLFFAVTFVKPPKADFAAVAGVFAIFQTIFATAYNMLMTKVDLFPLAVAAATIVSVIGALGFIKSSKES